MTQLQATKHDYQGALCGNYYSNDANGQFESWEAFKQQWSGFLSEEPPFDDYDDTYHYLFRFDVHEREDEEGSATFELELCFLLQRKGIYVHLTISPITEADWAEIRVWLKGRQAYQQALWAGIEEEKEGEKA